MSFSFLFFLHSCTSTTSIHHHPRLHANTSTHNTSASPRVHHPHQQSRFFFSFFSFILIRIRTQHIRIHTPTRSSACPRPCTHILGNHISKCFFFFFLFFFFHSYASIRTRNASALPPTRVHHPHLRFFFFFSFFSFPSSVRTQCIRTDTQCVQTPIHHPHPRGHATHPCANTSARRVHTPRLSKFFFVFFVCLY